MISKKYGSQYDLQNDGRTTEFYGKSTDTKPVDSSVANGSVFVEMDTGKVYMFDAEDNEWIEQ